MRLSILISEICIFIFIAFNVNAQTEDRPRPEEWSKLVFGGRFMDRFLPMPELGMKTSETWGTSSVKPRFTDNGIENKKWSFWGGNIILGEDGKYHLYVCGWPENSPKGHGTWPDSKVFNAVSDASFGPFVVKDTIGKGHNPEVFKLKDGRYVIYVIGGYYISKSSNGPWSYSHFDLLNRDRQLIEGDSNFTFAQREDGSYLMICRGGGQWFSETGLTPYNQVTGTRLDDGNQIVPLRAYPPVKGNFEDPVVWRDNVQYNLIVNDWLGRIARYERSKDGVNWKVESGEAYLPGVSVHEDGTVENWFKYERLKVFQDQYGRATQANFAVIDTLKKEDKANDNHSSKNIVIPLTVGRLLTILDKNPITVKTKAIRVKVEAEPGFDPINDMDINSLQFGDPEEVNLGNGGKVLQSEAAGNDLIVTFSATGKAFPEDEFAAKMIGKMNTGKLLFGYARLPWVNFKEPILSSLLPEITPTTEGFNLKLMVQNFGESPAKIVRIKVGIIKDGVETEIASGKTSYLYPYEKARVDLICGKIFEPGKEYTFVVTINPDKKNPTILHGKLIPLKEKN